MLLRPTLRFGTLVTLSGLLTTPIAEAQQYVALSRNLFGEIGILDMPVAHMAEEGELSFTVGDIGQDQHYNLSAQLTPWLEGAFRFSALSSHYYDRSFSLKVRMLEETDTLPDFSVGIRDLMGTGVYSSEYMVLSKRIGTLDVSAGIGWGRLSDRSVADNPFGSLSSSFKDRPGIGVNGTGNVDWGQFFHGRKIGAFGGLIWQTPIEGLSLQAEYSSDKYTYDARYARFTYRSPVNVGLSYRLLENVQVSGGWMYGNTYGFSVSLVGNATSDTNSALRVGPSVPPAVVRDPLAQKNALVAVLTGPGKTPVGLSSSDQEPAADVALPPAWKPYDAPLSGPAARSFEDTLREEMTAQGVGLLTAKLSQTDVWVYFENTRYRTDSEAAARIVRLLMAAAPSSVEYFHLIPVAFGLPMQEIQVVRSSLERAVVNGGTVRELETFVTMRPAPLDTPELDVALRRSYPRLSWSLDPKMTEHVFDPNDPLQFMLYANAAATLELAAGLSLSTVWTGNLWNDYRLDRRADSALPHVRTDLLQYIQKGKYGMANLKADYRTRLSEEVFASWRIGYLEDMFAGTGGQVLWRPQGSRFALGADLYQVWKRDFNRMFGLQDYNVLTGHVTLYYESPWYDLDFKIHAGRYLARDYGATFEVTRRFASGVEVGAFATVTNVPSHKFGEGSFDKGLIIRIPLQWALPIFSQSSYDLHMSSLTRDGGQRLADDDSLYEETRRASYGEISQNIDDFLAP